jgi:hypothetical protein
MMKKRPFLFVIPTALMACGCGEAPDAGGVAVTKTTEAGAQSTAAQRASAPRADVRAAEAAVRAIYEPYLMSAEQMATADIAGPMDRPIYSAELSRIIAAWIAANQGPEPTDFASVDWICGCQDWNAGSGSLTIGSVTARDDGRVQVTASFNPGCDGTNTSRDFFMVEENGRWLVDDASFAAAEPMLREILIDETSPSRRLGPSS